MITLKSKQTKHLFWKDNIFRMEEKNPTVYL